MKAAVFPSGGGFGYWGKVPSCPGSLCRGGGVEAASCSADTALEAAQEVADRFGIPVDEVTTFSTTEEAERYARHPECVVKLGVAAMRN